MARQPKRKRLGFISLSFSGGKWHARWTDPLTGADCKRVLPVQTEEQATAWAWDTNRLICDRRSIPGMRSEHAGKTVREALIESVNAAGGREAHRRNQLYGVNQFLDYLEKQFPSVHSWSDVTPGVFNAFVRDLRGRKIAFDTARLYLAPIRQASRFWSLEEPDSYRDFAALSRSKIQRSDLKPVNVLEPDQVRKLLAWLREHQPRLCAMASLMAMCGLRELEATYLRAVDVDWSAGTVSVSHSAWHAPKCAVSGRTIPAHSEALEAIRFYLGDSKVQDVNPESPIFLNAYGRPWKDRGVFNLWKLTMRSARAALPFLEGFRPRDLRKCFATYARRANADDRVLKAYLGQSRGDVLGRHYEHIGMDQLKKVVACFSTEWERDNGSGKEAIRKPENVSEEVSAQ